MIQSGQVLAFELVPSQREPKTVDLGSIFPIGKIEVHGCAVQVSLSVDGDEFAKLGGYDADGATARYVHLECVEGRAAAVCIRAGDGLVAQACPYWAENPECSGGQQDVTAPDLPGNNDVICGAGGLSVAPITLGKRKGQYLAFFPILGKASWYIAYAYGQTPSGPFDQAHMAYRIAKESQCTTDTFVSAKIQNFPSCPEKMFVSYATNEDGGRHFPQQYIQLEDTSVDLLEKMLSEVYAQRTVLFGILNRHMRPNCAVLAGDSLIHEYQADEFLGRHMPVFNRGIGGDTTAGLLKRLDVSVIALNPSAVFLLIGTNDIGADRSDQEILSNYEKILCRIVEELPLCRVHVISLLPINNSKHPKIEPGAVWIRTNERIRAVNRKLLDMAQRHGVKYVDAHSALADGNGLLALPYTREGLHLSSEGYEVLTEVLRPYLLE